MIALFSVYVYSTPAVQYEHIWRNFSTASHSSFTDAHRIQPVLNNIQSSISRIVDVDQMSTVPGMNIEP